MADFVEMMKQAKRMCDHYSVKGECSKCPLSRDNTECGCSLCVEIGSIDAKEAVEIERAVEVWAAEHPVPRYPTWNEWQKSTFPGADDDMLPCRPARRPAGCPDRPEDRGCPSACRGDRASRAACRPHRFSNVACCKPALPSPEGAGAARWSG